MFLLPFMTLEYPLILEIRLKLFQKYVNKCRSQEFVTVHDQSLRKHAYKKWKVDDWSCNKNAKMDDSFTISHYQTEEPKTIEITTLISLEV